MYARFVLVSVVLAELLQGGLFSQSQIRVSRQSSIAPSSPTTDATECGIGIKYTPLIYGGTSTLEGEYPWLVALFYRQQNYKFRCSGSLITNIHVITAAHCVDGINKNKLLLVFGKRNINNWNANATIRNAENIIVHPEYVTVSDADVSVIIIDAPVTFSNLIRPVCLWDDPIELYPLIGKHGTIVGWGENETSNILDEARKIDIPIVDGETCLRSDFQFYTLTSNRTFCAGKRDGKIPCRGDSGGGFYMKHGGRWKLRGVVSASLTVSLDESTLCDGSHYAVFTDIPKYLTWLESILEGPKIKDANIKVMKIRDVNITGYIRSNTGISSNITFDLEYTSDFKNIYSYAVDTSIAKSLNIDQNVLKYSRVFAVKHNDSIIYYRKFYSVRYFPSSTYEISIACCSEGSGNGTCSIVSLCTIYSRCKFSQKIYYHTAPIKPEIHLKNMISCDANMCEIDVNITNVQKENSTLYLFQQNHGEEITMDFVKNVRRMESTSAIQIPWIRSDHINVKFNKTDLCKNKILLLLVNDYMELLDYTTKPLLTNQIDCIP